MRQGGAEGVGSLTGGVDGCQFAGGLEGVDSCVSFDKDALHGGARHSQVCLIGAINQ
ncbi:hypothetical protein [Rothia nasimurium]|uniref:hypothetical protein n=1 Tax=Rothia nasimurium TaxID=85336 RepID=UPI001D1668BA|nr:hypothetical protein [Rothia nasimurium]